MSTTSNDLDLAATSTEGLRVAEAHYAREFACTSVTRSRLNVVTGLRERFVVDARRAQQAGEMLAAIRAELAARRS